jgi:hypothetical protein
MRQVSASLPRIVPAVLCAVALAFVATALPEASDTAPDKNAKPSIKVKASPIVAFAPARVVLTAEVKGGANDYEEFYCPTVEWEFGDGTKAEATTDCDPYEAGKSEIKRRYTHDRVFRIPGDFNVEFRLKQKNKTVATARTSIKVRPGLQDGFDDRFER